MSEIIMKKQFVIWGAGIRGKRICSFLGDEYVKAFVEMDSKKVGSTYHNIPIIDYDEYKNYLLDYFIIISPLNYEEVEQHLIKDKVVCYFTLKDCPAEMKSKRMIPIMDNFPYKIDRSKSYAVLGNSLFSLILLDYLQAFESMEVKMLLPPDTRSEFIDKITDRNGSACVAKVGESFDVVFSTVRIVPVSLADIYGNCIVEAYDFSDIISDYFSRDLQKFKDIHVGKKCFIVGTGPSLSFDDLDKLRRNNVLCFSMNMIFKAFESTTWRPDYYVVEDADAIKDYWDTIIDLDVPYKFLSDSAFADKKALDENIYRYHAHAEDYLPDLPKFSGDISRKLYSGYTVTYICLQFAVYMGFNEIYLLGVDFSYSKDMTSNGNHFISNYHADGDGVAGFYYEECLASYKKARQYAESKGIKIFNATRGGKLEVFPRKSLEMALKEL
jgi:hypothetical protein